MRYRTLQCSEIALFEKVDWALVFPEEEEKIKIKNSGSEPFYLNCFHSLIMISSIRLLKMVPNAVLNVENV